MWLGDERAAMVVDDVRALPASPLVVAEGDVISPSLVDPSRAVWLAPDGAFQLGHRSARWVVLGRPIEDARRRGITVVRVDGSRDVAAVVAEVEWALAGPLEAGPHAASVEERRRLLREANLAAVAQVRDGCARPWSTADPDSQVRSFVCECGDRDCTAEPDVTVATAAAAPVLAPGHG